MNTVAQVMDRGSRPAYVRFERVAVEDPLASKRAGRAMTRDVDYALVTAPYSKDIFKQKVVAWFDTLDQQVRGERIPQEWVDRYKAAYEAWKNGQELPLSGTPIKGWPVISPAQQANLIAISVLTVEDLASINDEGLRRFGMGGVELKTKAVAWLAQALDKGPLTMEIADLRKKNDLLKLNLGTLTAALDELKGQLAASSVARETPGDITASDVIDDEPVQRRGPGRPRKDAA